MRLSTAGSRLREAALTGLSIFAVAAAGLVFTYRTAQEALLDQIRSQIRQNASLVASQIEPRLHASLTRLEQMDGADYRRTAAPLLQMCQSVPGIHYAYTLIPGPKGPRFVLDSSRFVRNPGDTSSVAGIGELYDDAPAAAREALGSGEATVSRDPYTDRWGTFGEWEGGALGSLFFGVVKEILVFVTGRRFIFFCFCLFFALCE